MPSLNQVNLIGNLGANPESRTLPSGDVVVSFSIAISETYINNRSEKKEIADWHRIELWGGLAEVALKYLQKGDMVYVVGTTSYAMYWAVVGAIAVNAGLYPTPVQA